MLVKEKKQADLLLRLQGRGLGEDCENFQTITGVRWCCGRCGHFLIGRVPSLLEWSGVRCRWLTRQSRAIQLVNRGAGRVNHHIVLHTVLSVDKLLDSIRGTFRIQIHSPGKVHQCQMSVAAQFVNLKNQKKN